MEPSKQDKILQLNNYVNQLETQIRKGKTKITDRPNGNPLLAYAIRANTKKVVDYLISQGANVNDVDRNGDPLIFLPFTNDLHDGTDMGRHLFSRGASPHVTMKTGERCKLEDVATNPTAKYWIREAKRQPEMPLKSLEALKSARCAWIKGLPFTVVGQPVAKKIVKEAVVNFKLNPKGNKPLVLLFAGPSGHGKSILSELIAEMASIPFVFIPCESFTDEKTMFGAQAPYMGCEKGSQLNNFITERHEKPGLVLLDEFEKTQYDVWNGFLTVFENGRYTDRRVREGKVLDCSQLIFVLTTNVADPRIVRFYAGSTILKAPEGTYPVADVDREYEKLCEAITLGAQENFGLPIVGRMNGMVPFIPFNKEEALVVSDSIVRESQLRFAEPKSDKKHIDPVRLDVTEAAVRLIASSYKPDLGARSLRNEVEYRIDMALTKEWLEKPGDRFHACEHENRVIVRTGPLPKDLSRSQGTLAEGEEPIVGHTDEDGADEVSGGEDEPDRNAVEAPDF